MTHFLVIGLCVAVWLYSLVVMANGGGMVSTLAMLLTAALAAVADGYFIWQGEAFDALLISGAIFLAFMLNLPFSSTSGDWIS